MKKHAGKWLASGFTGFFMAMGMLHAGALADPVIQPKQLQRVLPAVSLKPDLVIDEVLLNSECNVVVRVRNNGPGKLPDDVWTTPNPKSAGVYLSINGSKWGGATIWKIDPARALQLPGGTAEYTSMLKVSGLSDIKAEVDLWNVVGESNEGNNVKSANLQCQSSPVQGNLSAFIQQCPMSAKPGQELGSTFTVKAKSTFPGQINNVAVDIILTSLPSYPSPAPYAVYKPNFSNGVLLKGGREHVSFTGPGMIAVKLNGTNTIPADTPPGVYFLGAIVDAGNQISEISENDNAAFCKISIRKDAGTAAPVAEDCVGFNPKTIQVKQISGNWKIVDGSHWVFDFGSSRDEAEKAYNIIKFYGMNQSCYVGRPDPSFRYLLVSGNAPSGSFSGEDCVAFNPNTIEVKQVSGNWKIVDGSHWVFDFGSNKDEAVTAMNIIKKYGFRYSCYVGRPDPSFMYLRK